MNILIPLITTCLFLIAGIIFSFKLQLGTIKKISTVSFILLTILNITFILPDLLPEGPWWYLQILDIVATFVFATYILFQKRTFIIFLMPQVLLMAYWGWFIYELMTVGLGNGVGSGIL